MSLNSLQHVYALPVRQQVCSSRVANYFVVIGLASIDCARLMHTLSDALDDQYSMRVINWL